MGSIKKLKNKDFNFVLCSQKNACNENAMLFGSIS